MRRQIKGAACLILFSMILTGCSWDTKIQVVEPKKSNFLTAESEGSLADQVQAPERYQCDKDINGYHLMANARVIVPDVEGIKLKKIRSKRFGTDDMKALQEALFGGAAPYLDPYMQGWEAEETKAMEMDGTNMASAENAEKELEWMDEDQSYAEAEQADPNYIPGSYKEAALYLKDFLDRKKTFTYFRQEDFYILQDVFAQAAKHAPNWLERQKIISLQIMCSTIADWDDTYYWEKKDLWDIAKIDRGYIYGTAISQDGMYDFSMSNGEGMDEIVFEASSSYVDLYLESEIIDFNAGKSRLVNIHEDNLSDLDLQAQSNELIKGIGTNRMELSDVLDCYAVYRNVRGVDTDNLSAEVLETPMKWFCYTPLVDGVPITFLNTNEYGARVSEDSLVRWPDERIFTVYGRGGLYGFSWSWPSVVEDWYDEYTFLLPFSEIQSIFEEMFTKNYVMDGTAFSSEITISEVRLGYAKVVSKELLQEDTNISEEDGETTYTAALVPAWDFIGAATAATAELYGVEENSRISYMTINATDGSIIER